MFAGEGNLCLEVKDAGYHAVATDIVYAESFEDLLKGLKTNPFDITTTSGLAYLCYIELNLDFCVQGWYTIYIYISKNIWCNVYIYRNPAYLWISSNIFIDHSHPLPFKVHGDRMKKMLYNCFYGWVICVICLDISSRM